MYEGIFSPMGIRMLLGAFLWVTFTLLIVFHRHGPEIVSGLFFASSIICMIVMPRSEVSWVLIMAGLFLYAYGVCKKRLRNPKA